MSDKLSLFSISKDLQNQLDSIIEQDGEINEINELAISKLSELLREKTDAVCSYRQSISEYLNILENRKNDLIEKIHQVEKMAERFDSYVNACLMTLQKNELVGSYSKISKRKPSKVVKITDENLIPIEFIKIPEPKPMIMKKEIGDLLKKGQSVPGTELVDSENIKINYKLK